MVYVSQYFIVELFISLNVFVHVNVLIVFVLKLSTVSFFTLPVLVLPHCACYHCQGCLNSLIFMVIFVHILLAFALKLSTV